MSVLTQEQIAETVESLRDSTEWFHCDCGIKMKAADMLEQLAAERDALKAEKQYGLERLMEMDDRAEAAKAEVARLREVITEMGEVAYNRARAALQEKPHDRQG